MTKKRSKTKGTLKFADVTFTPMDGSRAAVLFWAMTSMDLSALSGGTLNPASYPASIGQGDVDQLAFAVHSNGGFIASLAAAQSAYASFRSAGMASLAWAVDQRVTDAQISTIATAL